MQLQLLALDGRISVRVRSEAGRSARAVSGQLTSVLDTTL